MRTSYLVCAFSIFLSSSVISFAVGENEAAQALNPWQTVAQEQIFNIAQVNGWSEHEITLLRDRLATGLQNVVPPNRITVIQANNGILNQRDQDAIEAQLNLLRATFPQPEAVEILANLPPPSDDDAGSGAIRIPSWPIALSDEVALCPGINPAHADYMDSVFGNLPMELWDIIFSFLSPEDLLNLTHALAAGTTEELFENFLLLENDPHGLARNNHHLLLAFLLERLTVPFDQILPMYANFCLPPGDPLSQQRAKLFKEAKLIATAYAKTLSLQDNRPSLIKKRLNDNATFKHLVKIEEQWQSFLSLDNPHYQSQLPHFSSNFLTLIYLILQLEEPHDNYTKKCIMNQILFVFIDMTRSNMQDNNPLAIYWDLNSHLRINNKIFLRTLIEIWNYHTCAGFLQKRNAPIMDQNGLLPVCYLLRAIIRERQAGSSQDVNYYIDQLFYFHPNADQLTTPVTREGLTLLEYAETLRVHGLDDELYNAIVARFNRQPAPVVEAILINQPPLQPINYQQAQQQIQNESHLYRNTALSAFVLIMSLVLFNSYM